MLFIIGRWLAILLHIVFVYILRFNYDPSVQAPRESHPEVQISGPNRYRYFTRSFGFSFYELKSLKYQLLSMPS